MADKSQKHLLCVVPLTRIPLTRGQDFYYTHNTKLPFGTLVRIHFGYREIDGIVIASKKDFTRAGGMRLKKITSLSEKQFITKQQWRLAQLISDYYHCPLGITLKHFVPERVSARKNHIAQIIKQKISPPTLSKKESTLVREISAQDSPQISLLHTLRYSHKEDVLMAIIQKMLTDHKIGQILYIVPELTLTQSVFKKLQQHFPTDSIVMLHSKLAKGSFYEKWQSVRTHDVKIIIGTRAALFAPFRKLSTVIVDEAHDIAHKQWDMQPRYDARTVAENLGKIFLCKTIFATGTPRVQDYDRFKRKNALFTLDPPSMSRINQGKILSVDMRHERWKKRYSPLSKPLIAALDTAINKKKQSLLFVNHQGMNTFSVCVECKNVLFCPRCKRALVESSQGHFHCLHCNYRTDTFPTCTTCKGITFRSVGIGTQKVEKEVQKLFPKARVARADAQAMRGVHAQEKLYAQFASGDIDVVIGTQMITKGWSNKNIGLTAMIDFDALLSIPEYTMDEKAFAHVMQLIERAGPCGQTFIQTFQVENPILTHAIAATYESFYEEQLSERKILSYPPLTRLIKASYRNKDAQTAEKVVAQAHKELSDLISDNTHFTLSDPHPPLLDHVRGFYYNQIIIKIKSEDTPKELTRFLRSRDHNWVIDVDPISMV